MPPHFTPTSDEGLRGRSGENGMLQGKIPVAVMGGGAQSTAAKAGGASQPVLYVEFRKDGVPVDPGPWWAANEGQKVRG